MPDENLPIYFQFFNEIGIIDQLSRTRLEANLPKGLIQPHFVVLNHLIRVKDGRTPLQLARAFQVPKTSMSHTLAGLVKHAFVDIRPNPEDGRSKCVYITPTGKAFREATILKLADGFGDMMKRFSPDDIAAALPFLAEVRSFLDENRG